MLPSALPLTLWSTLLSTVEALHLVCVAGKLDLDTTLPTAAVYPRVRLLHASLLSLFCLVLLRFLQELQRSREAQAGGRSGPGYVEGHPASQKHHRRSYAVSLRNSYSIESAIQTKHETSKLLVGPPSTIEHLAIFWQRVAQLLLLPLLRGCKCHYYCCARYCCLYRCRLLLLYTRVESAMQKNVHAYRMQGKALGVGRLLGLQRQPGVTTGGAPSTKPAYLTYTEIITTYQQVYAGLWGWDSRCRGGSDVRCRELPAIVQKL